MVVGVSAVSPELDSLFIVGTKLTTDLKNCITSATLSLSTSQVTQLTIELVDKHFEILGSGVLDIGVPVKYKELDFVISNVETKSVNNSEGLTIKCRPSIVQKLKNRQGTKVMKKASPSQFVISECKAVGAKYLVQPSSVRKSVARDKAKSKERYETDAKPSSWTTFNRLADELGFILFEVAGVIYFGKPTWFLDNAKKSPLAVRWTRDHRDPLGSNEIPAIAKSVDSRQVTVQLSVPRTRAKECRPGRALKLSGVKNFDGFYLIDSVEYNLTSLTDQISIQASTALNQAGSKAKPSSADPGISGGTGTIYKTVITSYTGVWPVPTKYKVTTNYGVKGNWPSGEHTGVDFAVPKGTAVYAVYDGIACVGGMETEYNKHVRLLVGSKTYIYADMDTISVYNGQTVKAGDKLGTTTTSLHFELRLPPFRYGVDAREPIGTLKKTANHVVTPGATTNSIVLGATFNAGRVNSGLATDFVSFALSRQGSSYLSSSSTDINNENLRVFDAPGLICWSLARVGVANFPVSTIEQQRYLQLKGANITVDEAYKIRGALLYTGSVGHVAISLGDGRTIEAANPTAGVASYTASSRGFTYAYKVPGLVY